MKKPAFYDSVIKKKFKSRDSLNGRNILSSRLHGPENLKKIQKNVKSTMSEFTDKTSVSVCLVIEFNKKN